MDYLDLKAIIAFVQKNWTAVTAAAVVLVTLVLMKRRKKANIIKAVDSFKIELVKAHVMADASCVLQTDSKYDCLFLALALPQPLPLQFGSIFLISVISGQTALMRSCFWQKLDITRFLVESKANLDAKDNMYYTPTT